MLCVEVVYFSREATRICISEPRVEVRLFLFLDIVQVLIGL